MKRGLLIILTFLLLISTVSALQVEYRPIQDEVLPGNSATYTIKIINNEPATLTTTIKSADLNWLIDQEIKNFTVAPGETKEHVVGFKPLSERIKPGNYGIRLVVETKLTSLEQLLPVKLLRYDEVLNADFLSKPVIDPRKGSIIILNIKNNNKVELNDLKLKLTSPHFEFTRSFDITQLGSEKIEVPVQLNPDTQEGEYQSNLEITLNGNVMVNQLLYYEVAEYDDLKELITPQEGLLLGGETITQKNDGNKQSSEKISRKFNWLSYLFTSFSPEPNQINKIDGKYVVEWDSNLAPQESITVSYKINYRAPAFIVILIALGIIIWYILRQKHAIVISKRPVVMRTPTGSIKVIKVLINIKNRGSLSIKNLTIVDRVPQEVKTPIQQGSLKPAQVKSSPQGSILVWNIIKIKPGEEKIISYMLEGNIKINKSLLLPQVFAKYKSFGRKISSKSSIVSIKEKTGY